VNLRTNDYYLDLRELPGGPRCVAQVLATNGYRTSYVQTRHFDVPVKQPDILLGETSGPVLFAQGFSREHGPITGEGIAWLDAESNVIHRGGSLDVRTLAPGMQQLSVRVEDADGQRRVNFVGIYDRATGLRVGPSAVL
jgi:hypothetical protein